MADDYDNLATRQSLLTRLKDWEDQQGWRDFFNTYWLLIFTTARRAGLNETDAQDVVQETILAVAKAMPKFKYDPAKCRFKTWLRLVIQRRIADHLRVQARQVPTVSLVSERDAEVDLYDNLPDPASLEPDPRWEEDWEHNLLRVALERVKAKVTALHFQIYDYHVRQGKTVAQTSRAFGVSAAKVYLEKHRVGRLVKREIAELQKSYA